MLFIFQWLLASSFLWALSFVFWRRLRGLGRVLDVMSLLLINLLLVSVVVMVFGLLGIFRTVYLSIGAVVGWCGILIWGRDALSDTIRDVHTVGRLLFGIVRRHPAMAGMLFVFHGVVLGRMLLHVWYLPPYIYDVNSYHLPRVAIWVQSGSLSIPHLPVKRVFWPAGFELIQAWWAVFPHHDAVVEMAGLPYYYLALLATYVMARKLGVSRIFSCWCASIYALTPGVALNAVSAKNDIAISAIYLYLAALWIRPVPATATGRRWLLSIVTGLMAIGMKPTLVFIAPGLLLLWPMGIRKSDFSFLRHFRFKLIPSLLLSAAFMLGGYWYVRNQIRFGNPFYPTSLTVADHLVAGTGGAGSEQQGAFSIDSMHEDVLMLWERKIYDDGGPYNPDLPFMTGWGWFVFSFGLPAFLWALWRNKPFRWMALCFVISLLLLFGWVEPDPWNMRFAQWFPALAVIAFSLMISDPLLVPIVKRSLVLLSVWLCALNGAAVLNNGYLSVTDWRAFLKTPVRERMIDPVIDSEIKRRIPAGLPVLFYAEGNDRFYPLYRPDFSRRMIYPDDRSRGYASAMEHYGVRYLYFPSSIGSKREIDRVNADLDNGHLINLGSGVYRHAD